MTFGFLSSSGVQQNCVTAWWKWNDTQIHVAPIFIWGVLSLLVGIPHPLPHSSWCDLCVDLRPCCASSLIFVWSFINSLVRLRVSWNHIGDVHVFRPSAAKPGRPYGVMYVLSSLSSSSWGTPTPPGLTPTGLARPPRLGWDLPTQARPPIWPDHVIGMRLSRDGALVPLLADGPCHRTNVSTFYTFIRLKR